MSAPRLDRPMCRYVDVGTGIRCNKMYCKMSNLRRHIRKCHQTNPQHQTRSRTANVGFPSWRTSSEDPSPQQVASWTAGTGMNNRMGWSMGGQLAAADRSWPSTHYLPPGSAIFNSQGQWTQPQLGWGPEINFEQHPLTNRTSAASSNRCLSTTSTTPSAGGQGLILRQPQEGVGNGLRSPRPIASSRAVAIATDLDGTLSSSPKLHAESSGQTPVVRDLGGRSSFPLQTGAATRDGDNEIASSNQLPNISSTGPGRRLPITYFKRIADAETRAALPTYQTKQSRRVRGQQRGIEWLTIGAKMKFDAHYQAVLAHWGVKLGHRGTCVLVSEAWRSSDPSVLMDRFRRHNYPGADGPRASYSSGDHSTSLARAFVWFNQWPRNGLELDNFIGGGPFKPMEASHLCHQAHCITHLTYEAANVNKDRQDCAQRAKSLRAQGEEVPAACSRHEPPCLLQHAALTTFEVYSLQFAVLRKARGLEPAPTPDRPSVYRFPTFETELPCSFHAVAVRPEDLTSEVPPAAAGKPDLSCKFCQRARFYQSIVAFWSHLIHKHDEISSEDRLNEIKAAARLWRTYWDKHSDGGKNGNATAVKLQQAVQQDFSWQTALEWKLRS